MSEKLNFASDYMEGAHPALLQRLAECNTVKSVGYGLDAFSEAAREKIRTACEAPGADIFFLAGGTQTNAAVISTMLRPWQGVISAASGHISTHEAGAIEAGGHKVLALAHVDGKLCAEEILRCFRSWQEDGNRDHLVMPGMVYLSQPTEYGTLYSLAELEAISWVCHENNLLLYVDGARLAYALACPENDVSLSDLARLCDAFYIGGTKCGALFGEAVVLPKHDTIPHFFTLIKQQGALLAKGFVTGLQFDTLFTDELYLRIGKNAIETADMLRRALIERGYVLPIASPTNQLFVSLPDDKLQELSEQVIMAYVEKLDETHTLMRFCTSWATEPEDVAALIQLL